MIIRKEGGSHVLYDHTGTTKISSHASHEEAVAAYARNQDKMSAPGENQTLKSKILRGRSQDRAEHVSGYEGGYDGPGHGGPDDEQSEEE